MSVSRHRRANLAVVCDKLWQCRVFKNWNFKKLIKLKNLLMKM